MSKKNKSFISKRLAYLYTGIAVYLLVVGVFITSLILFSFGYAIFLILKDII